MGKILLPLQSVVNVLYTSYHNGNILFLIAELVNSQGVGARVTTNLVVSFANRFGVL